MAETEAAETGAKNGKFEPSKHLSDLRGKDYLEVKWRLVWLRDVAPDAVIETELKDHQAGFALFRAHVTLPSGASATGWGSETKDDFGDFIEKAETKALGRALAALGFGTQFCDDFGEGGSVSDSPVAPRRPRPAPTRPASGPPPRKEGAPPPPPPRTAAAAENGNAPITDEQIRAIRAMLTSAFGDDEQAAVEWLQAQEPDAVTGTEIHLRTGEKIVSKVAAGEIITALNKLKANP